LDKINETRNKISTYELNILNLSPGENQTYAQANSLQVKAIISQPVRDVGGG